MHDLARRGGGEELRENLSLSHAREDEEDTTHVTARETGVTRGRERGKKERFTENAISFSGEGRGGGEKNYSGKRMGTKVTRSVLQYFFSVEQNAIF